MAGGEDDAGLSDTSSWRLSVLFLLIVLLSLLGHVGLHKLEEYFRKNKRNGLRHTLESLKDELFALGLITLLLIVFEDQLVKICIKDDDYDDSYSKYDSNYNKARRLLAGGGHSCASGYEPLWSIKVLHDIHIFIFLIAIIHLVYAAVSMTLAWLKVRRWRKWEKLMVHDMQPLRKKWMVKTGGSYWGLWIKAFFFQFLETVDGPIYLALRRLFIERMELDDDFDFHKFVVDSLEADFAKMVEFEWLMWLVAAVWILLPHQVYAIIWVPCLFLCLQLIVGAKLESVIIQLSTLAYTHYSPHFIPFKDRKKKYGEEGGKPGLFRRSANVMRNMLSRNSLTRVSGGSGGKEGDGVVQNGGLRHAKSLEEEEAKQIPNIVNAVSDPSEFKRASLEIEKNQKRKESEVKIDIDDDDTQPEKPFKRRGCFYVDTKTNKIISRRMSQHFAQKYLLKDAADLFWFRKPKILLRIFQYAYFQSGLEAAILILEQWKGGFSNSKKTSDALFLIMLGVNLIVMIHAALFLLPMYALTTAAGSHCPERVLKKALKKNVNPELAERLQLERTSFTRQGSVTSDDSNSEVQVAAVSGSPEKSNLKRKSNHKAHHHDPSYTGPINSLLEAMNQAQSRKKLNPDGERPDLLRHSIGAAVGGRGQITGRAVQSLETLIENSLRERNSFRERNISRIHDDGVHSEPDLEEAAAAHASLSQVYEVFEHAEKNNTPNSSTNEMIEPRSKSQPLLDEETLRTFNKKWRESLEGKRPSLDNEIEVVLGKTDSEEKIQYKIPLKNINKQQNNDNNNQINFKSAFDNNGDTEGDQQNENASSYENFEDVPEQTDSDEKIQSNNLSKNIKQTNNNTNNDNDSKQVPGQTDLHEIRQNLGLNQKIESKIPSKNNIQTNNNSNSNNNNNNSNQVNLKRDDDVNDDRGGDWYNAVPILHASSYENFEDVPEFEEENLNTDQNSNQQNVRQNKNNSNLK